MGCCFSEPVDFDGDINLWHFDLHRVVGKGAFGKVRVVEHKKSNQLYALKYIDKSSCIRQKAVANIIQERRLLEEHPFVVNLRYAFQDDGNCFFVLDLMLGGDLRFHLERFPVVPEEVVRFWVAELCLAINHLHRHKIVHRDIKPDNILLDEAGHAHLTDFNVALHYSATRKHSSVAGSMPYMAPQVIGRKGYSWEIDYWSLGVTAYELLFRRRPFKARTAEKLAHAITKSSVKFPEDASEKCSPEGQDALKSFIERDPSRRLGCVPLDQQIADVRCHRWFASIDWKKLEAKECQPPFVPDMQSANFDVAHELDEFLMVEKPLTHSKRKVNPDDLNKLKPELRQLEEQFTPYDHTRTRRSSYYPHNQPVSTVSMDMPRSDSADLALMPTIVEPSRSNTPLPLGRSTPSP
ncbi:kinase-like protein [Pterulicium gracile]|uniref:Kinase-like protein n=1 Tax=Pterulicium gracile TaxID=1884261 RepID=A0A5C3QUD3_9AGAR|nr:kinase-like protein [Pterula gracilis]